MATFLGNAAHDRADRCPLLGADLVVELPMFTLVEDVEEGAVRIVALGHTRKLHRPNALSEES